MHYLCLVFRQESEPSERDTQAETRALVGALVESGYDISAYPLAPSSEATTLRRTGDGLVLTDGPVTTGSARLQTVYVIGARDLNDAIRIAAWLPEARNAEVEIRSISALPARTADPPPSETSPQESPASSELSMTVAGQGHKSQPQQGVDHDQQSPVGRPGPVSAGHGVSRRHQAHER